MVKKLGCSYTQQMAAAGGTYIGKAPKKRVWNPRFPNRTAWAVFYDAVHPLVSAVDFDPEVQTHMTRVFNWIAEEVGRGRR